MASTKATQTVIVPGKTLLTAALGITNYADYKAHFALYSKSEGHRLPPLEVFLNCHSRGNFRNWERWNDRSWRNNFNKGYILSMARISQRQHLWLFCGVFEVLSRRQVQPRKKGTKPYWRYAITSPPNRIGRQHEGKLVVHFVNDRVQHRKLDRCYRRIVICQPRLRNVYQGVTIP